MKLISAAVVAAVVLGAYFQWLNMRVPQGLGISDGLLKPLSPRPNGVSSQARELSKQVAALPFKQDANSSMRAVRLALKEIGNNRILSERDNYLHAVFVSARLRFRDDVEIYLDSDAQVIHYRSQSRVGYSDLGVNRERYQRFAELYARD